MVVAGEGAIDQIDRINLGTELAASPDHVLPARLAALLGALPSGSLPLQAACTQGGMVDEGRIAFSVLAVVREGTWLRARVGVLFDELVGGCNCHDDPAGSHVYGLLELEVDLASGWAEVRVAPG